MNNRKPNVLIIQTDQQSTWTMGCYGGDLIHTPNIDSLAEEGVKFNQFFTISAVCTPSRGSFMTGRYPHCHGAYTNNLELNRDEVTLAHVLQNQGYETAYIGKWHLDGSAVPGWIRPERSMGFADCRWMFNRGHWKSMLDRENDKPEASKKIGNEKTYTTDWLADKTIEFLRNRDTNKPFFAMVSIPDPHTPFTVREPYSTMFDPEAMTVPSTFYPQDPPDWALEAHEDAKKLFNKQWSEKVLKQLKAQYLGEVKCIDDNVGKLLNSLRELGILDDTVVVFTSDHGEYMGEHGLMTKNNLYETAHRIPLLIRWPGAIQANTIVDELVGNVDFQQTILGLLGIPTSGREQGRDASPLIRRENAPWRNEVFLHHNTLDRAGIFTDQYELAFVRGRDAILFDRRSDPEQIRNLYSQPEYREVIRDLTIRILEHHRQWASPSLHWLEPVEESLSGGS